MTHEDCPRFQTCNAAICPLDPAWRKAVHLPGEKVCYYLLNIVKAGADERFEENPVAQAVSEKAADVHAAHPDIAKRVARAAKTGFKDANLGGRTGARQPKVTSGPLAAE